MLRVLYLSALVVLFAACGGGETANTGDGHNHDHAHHDGHDHSHDGHDHSHDGHDHSHDGHDHGHSHEAPKGDGVHFGVKEIDAEGAMPMADVVAKLEAADGLEDVEIGSGESAIKVKGFTTKVEGQVSEICRSAGCWFTFADDNGKELFFNMKEHKGVPTDCKGKTLVVEGTAYQLVTSIEELKAEKKESGATEEELAAITEPKKEYKFIAEGVYLKK
ncbi:MAG: DUF4920 domain-containing protein [Saprospiraceae bacterium]|nr:DUF4920 domain-containing protein [Saprospiraceae bacterium]